jgi:hypothetical protein
MRTSSSLVAVVVVAALVVAPDVGAIAGIAAGQKLLPIDEAATDPTLARVRDQLRSTAQSRDIDRLVPLLAEEVITVDHRRARSEFVAWLRSGPAPDRNRFWTDLEDALRFGFARSKDFPQTLCAPYPAERLDDLDERQGAILGTGVNLRAEPKISSPVLETLSHDIVDLDLHLGLMPANEVEKGQYNWVGVRTPADKVGWVLSRYIWFFGSPRACVRKEGGQWRLWLVSETD